MEQEYDEGKKRLLGWEIMIHEGGRGVLVLFIIGAVLLTFGRGLEVGGPFFSSDTFTIVVIMGIAIAFFIHFGYIWLRFSSFFYIIGPRHVIIQQGILNITRVILPYEKIQNVASTANFFQNMLGVAEVKIDTAGGNPNKAEGIIPGIKDYQYVVSEISRRVDDAKRKGMSSGV
ncbi:PH domain-containing protein [Candidatus Micrarchaeota archaeon]|nr:PH domain-containing protein [Candidatus Micrarchaeota archaeon]